LEKDPISRTIIVYMAGDNDLSDDALKNLEEMEQGYTGCEVNLLVFADLRNTNPILLKINEITREVIQVYPELNSADPFVLRDILSEVIEMYPADELGLILWSHGTSWLPAGSLLRSFGDDNGKQMDISDLSENLPVRFDFILFDACLMGSVEVAYELKDKTDYIIAVIDTKQLTGLADEMRQIVTKCNINPLFNRQSVQRLDVYNEQYVFDLADFVKKAYHHSDTQSFTFQLNRSILYKNATPMFLSMYEIETYCGLSCYIPCPEREDLNIYYKSLQWYKDTGMDI